MVSPASGSLKSRVPGNQAGLAIDALADRTAEIIEAAGTALLLPVNRPGEPTIKTNHALREIHIFGGRCPYSSRAPYRVRFVACKTLLGAMSELCLIAAEGWFGTDIWPRPVAALLQIHMELNGLPR